MKRIELPRPIGDYFAFAELPPGDGGRRFTITFPYFEDGRLDRLQWWWQFSAAQERHGGDAALVRARQEAAGRFGAHIETWLANGNRCLSGGDPFPILQKSLAAPVPNTSAAEDAPGTGEPLVAAGQGVIGQALEQDLPAWQVRRAAGH